MTIKKNNLIEDSLIVKSYQQAEIGHWVLDLVSEELFWSKEVRNLHEVDKSFQPNLKSAMNFYPEGESRTAIQGAINEAKEYGNSYDLELRIITAKGNTKWLRTTGDVIREKGKVTKIYGSTQDITKRKHAEAELAKSEERFRVAQEHSPDGFTILQPVRNEQDKIVDFIWLYENESIAQINGTNQLNVTGKRVLDLFPSHKGSEVFDSYIEVANTGRPKVLEDVFVGEVLSEPTWLRLVITSMGEEIAIFAQNVTQQKQAEELKKAKMSRLDKQHEMISEMTFDDSILKGTLKDALEVVTRRVADTLKVDRASIWQISEDRNTLKRLVLFDSTFDTGSQNSIYDIQVFPSYFRALKNDSQIDASDAQNDPRTIELSKYYLKPLEIDSLIDSVVQQDGNIIGILSVEHRGEIRSWHSDEKSFLTAVSHLVAQIIANAERKRAEEKLRLFKRAVDSSSVTIVITNSKGNIEYVNPFFTKATGYSEAEVLGENPRILKSGKQSDEFYKKMWVSLKSGKEWSGEFLNKKKGGELFWERAVISPVYTIDSSEISHFIAIKEDVTELRNKENDLKQSLKEKETLLSEIHHRVKNNLAVISAMLQLQSFTENDPKILELLMTCTTRIKTIANIHENLYQNNSFSEIQISENIRKLLSDIQKVYNDSGRIKVDLDLSETHLNINQAVPCSLIINEVVVNSFKHAFQGKKDGTISIQISENDDKIMIRISDDGVGIPKDYMKKKKSIGISIIDVLTEQLSGKSQYKLLEQGTEFKLTFYRRTVKGSSSAQVN